jgi:hypothetical protein
VAGGFGEGEQTHQPPQLSGFIHRHPCDQAEAEHDQHQGVHQPMSGQASFRGVAADAQGSEISQGRQTLVPLAEQQSDPDAEIGAVEAHDAEMPVAAAGQPAPQGEQLGHGGTTAAPEHRIGVVDLQATGGHQQQHHQVEGMEGPGPQRAMADRRRRLHGGLLDLRGRT